MSYTIGQNMIRYVMYILHQKFMYFKLYPYVVMVPTTTAIAIVISFLNCIYILILMLPNIQTWTNIRMVPRNFTYPINLLHFNPVDSNFVYAWPLRWICFLYFTYLYKINYTYIYGIFPFCTNFKYAGICFFFCSFSVALSRLLFRAYYPASCAFTHTHIRSA